MKTKIINVRYLCARCQVRRALFVTRKNRHYRGDKDHDLCFRCSRTYKAIRDRWTRENTLDGWLL